MKGSVKNTGDARVEITLEGEKKDIDEFIRRLKSENPSIARVDSVKISRSDKPKGLEKFRILKSDEEKTGKSSIIPPDIGICDDCREELLDPSDRRYLYPFISCVNCGPRFSIIENVPYDRERTSMKEFPLCVCCHDEYTDPRDRRYHGQTISCDRNGPEMKLYGPEGNEIEGKKPIKKAAKMLDEGKTGVVKGIGGMHIASKTTDDSIISEMRERFKRPQQPFAIMVRDLKTVREFTEVGEREEELLVSNRRPITLLREREKSPISELISPGLNTIGVMLPYSGIHVMLFSYGEEPAYVMTSANMPGLPMVVENSEAFRRLGDKLDFLLLHNREIVNRCDDSVVRVSGGSRTFLRRSRGYVPTPIEADLDEGKNVLAIGADLDNTISVTEGGRVYPSQYIGDVENLETETHLRDTVERFLKLLGVGTPEAIVRDKHPGFRTSEIAEELGEEYGTEVIEVQHHRAHVHSLLAEHELDRITAVTADGVGYGDDGTVWGGEVFSVGEEEIPRVGGIESYRLPGGDLATKYPARAVAGILWEDNDEDFVIDVLQDYCEEWLRDGEIEVTLQQLKRNLNSPVASSTGRVLDAVSCLLGACGSRTYEGEPAMKLEAFAERGEPGSVNLEVPVFDKEGRKLFSPSKLLENVIEKVESGGKKEDIASAAQYAVADAFADIAMEVSGEKETKNVGVSGGIFYNDAITGRMKDRIEDENLNFFQNVKIPPGDGGISIGQALAGAKRFD